MAAKRSRTQQSDRPRTGGRGKPSTAPTRRKSCYFCKDKVDEIDKKSEGTYHLLHFDSDAETLAEVTRVLKITDGALRHMAVRRSAAQPRRTEAVQPAG